MVAQNVFSQVAVLLAYFSLANKKLCKEHE